MRVLKRCCVNYTTSILVPQIFRSQTINGSEASADGVRFLTDHRLPVDSPVQRIEWPFDIFVGLKKTDLHLPSVLDRL